MTRCSAMPTTPTRLFKGMDFGLGRRHQARPVLHSQRLQGRGSWRSQGCNPVWQLTAAADCRMDVPHGCAPLAQPLHCVTVTSWPAMRQSSATSHLQPPRLPHQRRVVGLAAGAEGQRRRQRSLRQALAGTPAKESACWHAGRMAFLKCSTPCMYLTQQLTGAGLSLHALRPCSVSQRPSPLLAHLVDRHKRGQRWHGHRDVQSAVHVTN